MGRLHSYSPHTRRLTMEDSSAIFTMFGHLMEGYMKGCKIMFDQKIVEIHGKPEDASASNLSKSLKPGVVRDLLKNNGLEVSDEKELENQEDVCYDEFLRYVTALLIKNEVKGSGKTLAGLTFGTFQLAVQTLAEVFRISDGDANGFITVAEMQEFMTILDGVEISNEETKEVLEIADKDGDGKVDW